MLNEWIDVLKLIDFKGYNLLLIPFFGVMESVAIRYEFDNFIIVSAWHGYSALPNAT